MHSLRLVSVIMALFFMPGLLKATAQVESLSANGLPLCEDYVLRTWELDDGLPSNHVFDIAQTPDGYLWVTTWSGLVRFDGVRFSPFFKEGFPGMESRARTVFAARDGALWIGLDGGG